MNPCDPATDAPDMTAIGDSHSVPRTAWAIALTPIARAVALVLVLGSAGRARESVGRVRLRVPPAAEYEYENRGRAPKCGRDLLRFFASVGFVLVLGFADVSRCAEIPR